MSQGWASDTGDLANSVRTLDRDRFLCSQFAPAERRPAILVLYAFNQELARIAESVSEPPLGQIRLRWWHDAVAAIFEGRSPPPHPVMPGLTEAIEKYDIERHSFDAILTARAFDLESEPPANLDDLIAYATGTSAALNALVLDVLGVKDDASADAARAAGIAWALIGLLRAVPHHARRRRLYLPADLCQAASITEDEIFAGKAKSIGTEIISVIAMEARRHLAEARSRRHEVDQAALPVLLPSILADTYLAQLAASGFDPFVAPSKSAGPLQIAALTWAAFRGRY